MGRIHNELRHHQDLRKLLGEMFPDADDETLRDTLEGESNLPEMLAEILRSVLEDEAFVAALKGRIGDMQERAGRLFERARKKRDVVAHVMAEAEMKKLVEPDLTVSLRPSRPPLVVVDQDIIPEDYWKPQDPKLDRQGLIAALSSGRQVPGASLGNAAMTISVRTK